MVSGMVLCFQIQVFGGVDDILVGFDVEKILFIVVCYGIYEFFIGFKIRICGFYSDYFIVNGNVFVYQLRVIVFCKVWSIVVYIY